MRGNLKGRIGAMLVSSMLVLNACSSDDDNADMQALPPEAFTLDPGPMNDNVPAGKTAEFENFLRAATTVGLVTIYIQSQIAIPAAVTAAAVDFEPVLDNGVYLWAGTTPVETGRNATLNLTGTTSGGVADFEMHVTYQGSRPEWNLNNFLLYSATFDVEDRSGTWDVYYPVLGVPVRMLSASFDVDSATDKQITFTVPDTGPITTRGSSVTYRVDGSLLSFDFTTSGGAHTLVTWDKNDKVGSVTSAGFNGGVAACFDENKRNAPCPSEV